MKKTILGALIGLVFASLIAFKAKTYEITKSTADVDQINGCYVFVNSKPVLPYQYLGTVELSRKDMRKNPGTSQYQHIRDVLLKKVKTQYPQAEGIIFNFHDGGVDKADALIYK